MTKFIEWLENQKKLAIELDAPVGEIDLLSRVISKGKDFQTGKKSKKLRIRDYWIIDL